MFVIQKKGNTHGNNYELFKIILDKDSNLNGIYDDLITEFKFLDLDIVINREIETFYYKVNLKKETL